ncbi:MAG: N-methylhydantoinase B [Gammaproteobacteria bacterium]|jgi:N-methylhydantoinase B
MSSIDAISLSVLWNGLVAVADDMGTTLRSTAYSAAVREGDDFSTGVFDAQGRLVAQGNFSPGHLGAMPYVVEHVLAHYPRETLAPGDCILLNDSAMGSGHYPDCFLTTPLFAPQTEAGELIGFAVNCAHHVDMGGAVPGSQIVAVKEAFQEGLRILPIRIADADGIREDVMRLILGNVRLPDIVRGDLLAQRNTNVVAARRMEALVRKYGLDLMREGIEAILEHSEARMRDLIEALPDGTCTYEDHLDDGANDVPIRFHAAVTIEGSDITIDWSQSDDQVQAGINSYINYTRAYSAFAVKVFTDPHLPLNHGANKPVHVVAREGSFFNPRFPAPSSGRAAVQIRLFEVVCGALSKIVPGRAMASFSHWGNPVIGGTNDDGTPFIFYDLLYGGYGGRAGHDGAESLCPVFNATNIPVEVHESSAPVRIQRMALIRDSGGAGQFRGGLGLQKDVELLADSASVSLSGDRHRFSPPGSAGGEAGARAQTTLVREGVASSLGSKDVVDLQRGDVLSLRLSGAGGFGPRSQRSHAAVCDDVADGYVSVEGARDDYGVEVMPDGRIK